MNKETQRRLEAQYQQSLEDGCVLTEPSEWKYVRMPASKRRALFPELYSHYDPDQIMAQEDPPADCLAHFKEIFGDFANPKLFDPTRVGWVKLKMHPHFRRWTIFEWAVDPRIMKYSWRPLYIACHEVEPGELPPDLKTTDGRYDNLKGSVGAYKVPTREDFWMVRYIGDRSLNTAESTCFKVMEDDDRAEKERERIRADKMRDRLDYLFNLYARDVNREDGSMQGFHVIPQESLDEVRKRSHVLIPVYGKDGEVLYHKQFPRIVYERYQEELRELQERRELESKVLAKPGTKSHKEMKQLSIEKLRQMVNQPFSEEDPNEQSKTIESATDKVGLFIQKAAKRVAQ